MPKSVFGGSHTHLVDVLKAARKNSGLTQAQLGTRVGKSQKFVSLIEQAQRRVDVLEFYALAKALGVSPVNLFSAVVQLLPDEIEI
ncbi:MAG: helix-turn-helix transcriptional regulator [Hyphomonadaceae bacterium]|nr:helix-turn-helix transcriptional regulator [Hyphomonadaceae bacterium]